MHYDHQICNKQHNTTLWLNISNVFQMSWNKPSHRITFRVFNCKNFSKMLNEPQGGATGHEAKHAGLWSNHYTKCLNTESHNYKHDIDKYDNQTSGSVTWTHNKENITADSFKKDFIMQSVWSTLDFLTVLFGIK